MFYRLGPGWCIRTRNCDPTCPRSISHRPQCDVLEGVRSFKLPSQCTTPHVATSDSSNQLCVTETLNNLQDIVGKLSFSDLDLSTLVGDFTTVVASASNLACTDCTKAAFTLVSPLTQQFPQATTGIDALCGANFIGGRSDVFF